MNGGMMADALDTHALNLEISEMFTHAKTRLIIVSPYLSIYPNLRKLIEDADNRGVNIVIIYRKVDEKSDVLDWIKSLKHIYLGRSDSLHAKYYAEDRVAIIASLNLYEYSQVNNEELGMIFDDRSDSNAFYDAFFFVQKIIEHSELEYATIKCEFYKKLLSKAPDVRFNMLDEPIVNIKNEEIVDTSDVNENIVDESRGFCIRCGKNIGMETEVYFCETCYERWKRYKNPQYQEKYCHVCGKPNQTSAYRPVCKDCFPSSSDVINRKRDRVLDNVK